MANFYVPMTIILEIKDINPEALEQYITDAIVGLSETFYSSDIDDDHFELHSNRIHWSEIQEA